MDFSWNDEQVSLKETIIKFAKKEVRIRRHL